MLSKLGSHVMINYMIKLCASLTLLKPFHLATEGLSKTVTIFTNVQNTFSDTIPLQKVYTSIVFPSQTFLYNLKRLKYMEVNIFARCPYLSTWQCGLYTCENHIVGHKNVKHVANIVKYSKTWLILWKLLLMNYTASYLSFSPSGSFSKLD